MRQLGAFGSVVPRWIAWYRNGRRDAEVTPVPVYEPPMGAARILGETKTETEMSKQDGLSDNATPEVIAYRLMLKVLEVEGRPLDGQGSAKGRTSRNIILDAYSDCIEAVRGGRGKRPARTPTP